MDMTFYKVFIYFVVINHTRGENKPVDLKSLIKEAGCPFYNKKQLLINHVCLRKMDDYVLQRVFNKAHRIVVGESHCYRKDLFRNKGWCKITDEVAPASPGTAAKPSTTWGFCSSSCKVEYMKVR